MASRDIKGMQMRARNGEEKKFGSEDGGSDWTGSGPFCLGHHWPPPSPNYTHTRQTALPWATWLDVKTLDGSDGWMWCLCREEGPWDTVKVSKLSFSFFFFTGRGLVIMFIRERWASEKAPRWPSWWMWRWKGLQSNRADHPYWGRVPFFPLRHVSPALRAALSRLLCGYNSHFVELTRRNGRSEKKKGRKTEKKKKKRAICDFEELQHFFLSSPERF